MTPTPEYFRNIDPKKCTDCGKSMEEMHESYLNQCDKCLRLIDHD
ncbi:protein YhfH [Halalkalibacter kiskunsagensis]|uniref:Protein YhfH n=1 Tax=Halalkalibacter kiskunsagensis TaxID=1548599 RepID=A0ABV6KDY0_9BACI